MSTGAVTSPQEIRIQNHKAKTTMWWKDPEYRALSDAFLKEHKECEYCHGKSTLVHHDNQDSYRSQEEYYKPENFTAACAKCHAAYRKGMVICPVCRQHYMKRGNDKCHWCRGMPHAGKKFNANYKDKARHPCGRRIAMQRCRRDGGLFVCGRSAKEARGCDHFIEREKRLVRP